MIDPRSVAVLAGRELRDAWRNRWFLLFTVTFAAAALALSWLSVVGVLGSGFAGFGRTAASLINLVALVVPLMGLILGANAIAGERETGALLYLLSQPVEPREMVLGKFLGLAGAVLSSLLLGFGVAALALGARGAAGRPGPYLAFLALAALVACGSVSLGLLVSALSRRVSVAAGIALFLWLLLVFLGDLGLMGTSLALRLEARELLLAALANPLQLFKLGAVLAVRGGLEVLGPAGQYAVRSFGAALLPLLLGLLAAWTIVPLAASALVMQRRGGLG